MDRLHIFLFAVGVGLVIRVVMHFVDKSRIKDDVESKGGRINSINWNPFGRGWFFEKNERHYSPRPDPAHDFTGCYQSW